MDFAEARRRMIDGQIKPNRVTDARIFLAMQEIPRELFVPEALRLRALADEDLVLGGGRVLLQPMTIARMIQLADVRPGERALVLSAGPGYGAAVLAHMGAQVVAVEDDAAIAALGDAAVAASGLPAGSLRREVGPVIGPVAGSATGGPAEGAAYDLILIEGAVPAIPSALAERLTEGGRLVAIRRGANEVGSAVLGRRVGGGLSVAEAFDVRTTVLPAFASRPGFVLA